MMVIRFLITKNIDNRDNERVSNNNRNNSNKVHL